MNTYSPTAAVCLQTESSSTGNRKLDELVDDLWPEGAAAALAAIEIAQRDHDLCYKLRDALRARLHAFLDGEDGPRDLQAEIMPTAEWMAFLDSYMAAHREEGE